MQHALFDHAQLARQRQRAEATFASADFVHREAASRLADRLLDLQKPFQHAAALGAHAPLQAALASHPRLGGLRYADRPAVDPESLPFAPQSLDALLSLWQLHWCNDMVGALVQARLALRPDGLLLAVLPGARTLQELRAAMLAVAGRFGMAPRIAPLPEVRDAGSLMQRAGFALPVVDSDLLTVTYPNLPALLADLKHAGETNCLVRRHFGLTTATYWRAVEETYTRTPDGRLAATVELLFLTGWAPHDGQQKPLARGSGAQPLAEVLTER